MRNTYYYGDNPSLETPFETLYAITHFIMPNFGTMNWDVVTRDNISKNLSRLNDRGGHLNDDIMMYIHIPYCKSFCHYCNFNKNHYPKQSEETLDTYVDYLIKEIDWYVNKEYIQSLNMTAIYIGGGTPSTLPQRSLEKLFSHLERVIPGFKNIEKTFTGDPRTLKDIDKLKTVKQYGFNRLTFGIETFDSKIKKSVGRSDTQEDIDELFNNLYKIGYEGDRCVDLMYDLPGQTLDGFASDLEILVKQYQPEEMDLFGTVYLPYRPLHKLIMLDKVPQPGTIWNLLAMKEYSYDFACSNGYNNTIAETFSKHSRRSQYQTAHCARQDIIGIGCAARGNLKDMVYVNPINLTEWCENIDRYGVSSNNIQSIGKEGVLDRIMVMFPRYKELKKELLELYSDTKRYKKVKKLLSKHIKKGVVYEDDDRYLVNKLGVVWVGNLQTEYMIHTSNLQGRMLLKCISDKKAKFSESKRFGRNVAIKFILSHPELYPLAMK